MEVKKHFGRRMGALMVGTAALAAAAAAPAAQAAGPASCGASIEDATGDGFVYPVPRSGDLKEEAPYMDITEAFFNVRDGSLTANIRLANLTEDADGGASYPHWARWSLNYTVGEQAYTASIDYEAGEFRFLNWKWQEGATTADEATGSVVMGENGVLSVDIPSDYIEGFAPGMEFTAVSADSAQEVSFGLPVNAFSDRAPDGSATTTLPAAVCGTESAPPPPGPVPGAEQVQQAASNAGAAATAAPVTPAAAAPRAATTAAKKAAKKCKAAKKAKKKSKKARKAAATCKAAKKKSKKARAKKRR